MTEGQVQGKYLLVRNNGEFEIIEFELAGSNCIYRTPSGRRFVSVLNSESLYVIAGCEKKSAVYMG